MNFISLIGVITVLLGAYLWLLLKRYKKNLGRGSYRAAYSLINMPLYSKALCLWESGSSIHSMEPIVGYSPRKSQNRVLLGGYTSFAVYSTRAFLVQDEILMIVGVFTNFAIIACFTGRLTACICFGVFTTFAGQNLFFIT
ncbi:hypothetical protein C4D60_Mb00t12600 [Musa balbisiana]|uniref:NADH:quinone oxidoreductase/Mrp antiporter membrane subunit domain-containing protein n=1 Tax=Musa balbisiana TaxID=52838 RepID=A0A4S8I8I0_MUSBA|nr:hypothetical protein C4D60_Mb00t12600 [Musa balbisiana]